MAVGNALNQVAGNNGIYTQPARAGSGNYKVRGGPNSNTKSVNDRISKQDPKAAVQYFNGKYYNYAGDPVAAPASQAAPAVQDTAPAYDAAAAEAAAKKAAEEAKKQEVMGYTSKMINNAIGLYGRLFGNVKNAAKSQIGALDKRYNQEVGGLTDQFNQELPKIGRAYAARGTYDSSYRGDSEQEATTGFNNQLQDIGTQREADAAKIGQYVATQEADIKGQKGLLQKLLAELPNVESLDELTQLKRDIDKQYAQIESSIAGNQSQEAYASKLGQIAPSADRMPALQATLTNIVNGAAPGALKRAVAQQIIGSSGLSKKEQDALLGQVNSQIQ